MKKTYLLMLIIAMAIIAGCVRVQDNVKSAEELEFEKAKELITQMGYDTSDVYKGHYGYVVEGDILITHEYLDDYLKMPQTRHTFNKGGRMVSLNNQNINLTGYNNAEYLRVLEQAAQYWNEKAGCNIKFATNATTLMSVSFEDFPNDAGTLMMVTPPNSIGLPGEIKINNHCLQLPNAFDQQAQYMIIHAIGHAIGFGHTPKDFTETVSDPKIQGTVDNDHYSIMVKEAVPVRWDGISEDDLQAFKIKYPIPLPEKKPDSFNNLTWEYNSGYAISLSDTGKFISPPQSENIKDCISMTGTQWASTLGYKVVRVLEKGSSIPLYVGEPDHNFSFGNKEYVIQLGANFKQPNGTNKCFYGEVTIKPLAITITTTIPDLNNVKLGYTKQYAINFGINSNLPEWEKPKASASMVNLTTGRTVYLAPRNSSGAIIGWTFHLLERGTYKIEVTLTNSKNVTVKGSRTFEVTPIYSGLLYGKMGTVKLPYGLNTTQTKHFIDFYSNPECTKRITSTPTNVKIVFAMVIDYYDVRGNFDERTKGLEEMVILEPGISSYDFPLMFVDAVYYTLNREEYSYEVIELKYE